MQLQPPPKNTRNTKTIAGCGKLGDAAQEVVARRCRSSYRHCQAGQPSHDQVMIMIIMIIITNIITIREEISVLSSARREEIRRQLDEAERYRANPVLYIFNPHG